MISRMKEKKFKILGKSISALGLGFALLIFVTITALAAWLIVVSTATGTVSTQDFSGLTTFQAQSDTPLVCQVGKTGNTINVTFNDAKLGDVCEVASIAPNNGIADGELNWNVSGAPPELILTDLTPGIVVLGGSGQATARLRIELDPILSSPGDAYPFSVDLEALPN